MITTDRQTTAIQQRLKSLQKEEFWGDWIITFKGGNVVYTVERKTTPIEQLVSEELVSLENANGQTQSHTAVAKKAR